MSNEPMIRSRHTIRAGKPCRDDHRHAVPARPPDSGDVSETLIMSTLLLILAISFLTFLIVRVIGAFESLPR